MAQPAGKSSALEDRLFPLDKLARQLGWIPVPMGPGGEGFIGIQGFHHNGRISSGNAIVRNGIDHDGAGAHDAVFSDGDALANNGPIAHPDVFL